MKTQVLKCITGCYRCLIDFLKYFASKERIMYFVLHSNTESRQLLFEYSDVEETLSAKA